MSFEEETSRADPTLRDRPLIDPWPLRDFTAALGAWVGEASRQATLLKQLGDGAQSLAGAARHAGVTLSDAPGPPLPTSQAVVTALAAAQASLSAAAGSRAQAHVLLAEAEKGAQQAVRQGDDVLLARRAIAVLVAFAFCLLVYVTLRG